MLYNECEECHAQIVYTNEERRMFKEYEEINDVPVDCNSYSACLHWSTDGICMVDIKEKEVDQMLKCETYSTDRLVTSKVYSHTYRVQAAIESSWSIPSSVNTGSSCGDANDDHERDRMVNTNVRTITQSLANELMLHYK